MLLNTDFADSARCYINHSFYFLTGDAEAYTNTVSS